MLKNIEIISTSLVNHENFQRVILNYHANKSCHLKLSVYNGKSVIFKDIDIAFTSGKSVAYIHLPVQKETLNAEWKFFDLDGCEVYSCFAEWKTPRDWTIYVMISSHTDIGLHNSQYIQRANSERFIDEAKKLTDLTRDGKDCDRYKYIMEGTWFWNNYPTDKGVKKARDTIENYAKKGDLGICCGVAGNVMQVLGLEELCRFAYERKKLEEKWGVKCQTMSMIDNNGLPLSIIQPLSDAGYKNIIFSPNQWNPIPSTIWQRNLEDDTYPWNPNAGGGGARIDFRYESDLPMVFFWENYNGDRLLVAGSTQYDNSGVPFGLFNKPQPALINKESDYISLTEIRTAKTLKLLEEKYDFNVWLLPCYSDDQAPNLWMQNKIKAWNEKWKYPKFDIIGNPDLPFNILRDKFYDKIPVVKGDITGGWYQLHPSVADFSTKKYQTDRLLPIAEKWSTVCCVLDKNFKYPKAEFERAYNHLLYNDEHSYGASGYRGRKVHETWLQHRDWVDKSYDFSNNQIHCAIDCISEKISAIKPSVVIFNPTNQAFETTVKIDDGQKFAYCKLPKFGYTVISKAQFKHNQITRYNTDEAPVVENDFYKLQFADNGSIKSVFDKQLDTELLDKNNPYNCNEIIYTKDNHKTFNTPNKAHFIVQKDCDGITIIINTAIPQLQADVEQKITLCDSEKKIIISNRILHAKDMYNLKSKQTYLRYIYIAFPFMVNNAKRLCHLNGTVMEYAKDVSGHCTDTYACTHDWCAVENNNINVALITKQPQLVEFDHIHVDKTDFGNAGKGSQIFCYVANDWLQMHVASGDDINYEFDYAITSNIGRINQTYLDNFSERFITPVHTAQIQAQKRTLPEKYTFFDFNTNSRFVTLKPADNGEGIVARFYGQETQKTLPRNCERVSTDEFPTDKFARKGFYAYKLKGYKVKYQKASKVLLSIDKPLPVGSHYTGLIDKPKATNGENNGQIYLIWGQNREKNLSHYELYRSTSPDFKVNKKTFVANVYPEQFVIARYSDEGLKDYTRYYYKVRAVNKNGVKGEFSEVFSATTREPIV